STSPCALSLELSSNLTQHDNKNRSTILQCVCDNCSANVNKKNDSSRNRNTAKVSAATVSRAINRVPSVNPVLARRIRKIIEKHGYYPNTNARALVRGPDRCVGGFTLWCPPIAAAKPLVDRD